MFENSGIFMIFFLFSVRPIYTSDIHVVSNVIDVYFENQSWGSQCIRKIVVAYLLLPSMGRRCGWRAAGGAGTARGAGCSCC